MTLAPPMALLAELTHRCPLRCPYCSNPMKLTRKRDELPGVAWRWLLDEAVDLGVLQVHFSGGEPAVRADLEELVAHAAKIGLYTNLITSGIGLGEPRVAALASAGLDHVQLSFQDAEGQNADRIAGLEGSFVRKLRVAQCFRQLGVALTVNAVVHRQNLARLEAIIELALKLGADRLEVAHAQYHGWALENRAALMPSADQLAAAVDVVAAARVRLKGNMEIDHVLPDYHAERPKPCMGGWGRRFIAVTPAGKVLPCHAAESLPGFQFQTIGHRPLADIWRNSEAFRRFRGTRWMRPPCRGCANREVDWGGCRCQAFALTGDPTNTDPVCSLSPYNSEIRGHAQRETKVPPPAFRYRGEVPLAGERD